MHGQNHIKFASYWMFTQWSSMITREVKLQLMVMCYKMWC